MTWETLRRFAAGGPGYLVKDGRVHVVTGPVYVAIPERELVGADLVLDPAAAEGIAAIQRARIGTRS